MKKKILVGISLIALGFGLVGCGGDDDKTKGAFIQNLGNCNVVFQQCMADRTQGETLKKRTEACEKARGMCGSMHIRGCMQKCVDQFGSNSSSTENCKRNCEKRTYY